MKYVASITLDQNSLKGNLTAYRTSESPTMHMQTEQTISITLPNGVAVILLPERGLFAPASNTLYITDTHFGKTSFFRSFGIAVPQDFLTASLDRLESLVARTNPSQLTILGDFLHTEDGGSPDVFSQIYAWRSLHPSLGIINVRGNHDRHAGDPPGYLSIRCVEEGYDDGVFQLSHEPVPHQDRFTLSGHLHPAVTLRGNGKQSMKLPCFWVSDRLAVLPAFTEFSSGASIKPRQGDRVYVIADDRVVEVSAT